MIRFALLLFLLTPLGAMAQSPVQSEARVTLSMDHSGVKVDGRQVQAHSLPASLDVRRLSERVFYTGPAGASFEIGGLRYRVEGRSIRLDQSPNRAPDLVLDPLDDDFATSGGFLFVPVDWASEPDEAMAYRMAARQEVVLDATALSLSAELMSLPPGPERDAARKRLRTLLFDAFSLKQANRAREIDLLQSELDALRSLHARRSEHRRQIVEARLSELAGDQ